MLNSLSADLDVTNTKCPPCQVEILELEPDDDSDPGDEDPTSLEQLETKLLTYADRICETMFWVGVTPELEAEADRVFDLIRGLQERLADTSNSSNGF